MLLCRELIMKKKIMIINEGLQNLNNNVKFTNKYTVNGLRLQANVASDVLTQIKLECTESVCAV